MPRISRDWIAGGILLIVGGFELALLLFPESAYLIPLLIGLGLIGVFLLLHQPALASSGGVISGIGVGIITARSGSPDFGGAGVLVSIGAGFLLVSVLGAIFETPTIRIWPLVPGSALIAAGAVIYAAGLGDEMLDVAENGWPLVLIVVGIYLLLAARFKLPPHGVARGPADDEEPTPDETSPVTQPPSS